jgi:hypothetical protein
MKPTQQSFLFVKNFSAPRKESDGSFCLRIKNVDFPRKWKHLPKLDQLIGTRLIAREKNRRWAGRPVGEGRKRNLMAAIVTPVILSRFSLNHTAFPRKAENRNRLRISSFCIRHRNKNGRGEAPL